MRVPRPTVKILVARRRKCAVSNHEAQTVASSFETLAPQAPQDEGMEFVCRRYSFTAPVMADT
jgi:hypothetical protein